MTPHDMALMTYLLFSGVAIVCWLMAQSPFIRKRPFYLLVGLASGRTFIGLVGGVCFTKEALSAL